MMANYLFMSSATNNLQPINFTKRSQSKSSCSLKIQDPSGKFYNTPFSLSEMRDVDENIQVIKLVTVKKISFLNHLLTLAAFVEQC